jgi:hypothetical protein
MLVFVPLAIIVGSSGWTRIATLATVAVTWVGTAFVEPFLLPDPFDRSARWRFYWLWLPAIAALFASATTAVLGAGRQARAFGAAWAAALGGVFLRMGTPTVRADFWECMFDVALPATLAASAAVLACELPRRR